ncbi:acetoin utilization protein AcuC [Geothrix oryzae]|uniref:Acetoin utilization protein AcuC n=1 Tax=Geothrix oryzae TaxID=2927975 RepID=A0ABM8DQ43_9BACT|nr:acetoin utilization protein AcuC [Geothrix oryzae]BDU69099.1 acetoin utilization protein AcuC [Geothrix oryzae]
MAALIHRPEYAGYDFGPEHPFTPARLGMLLDLIQSLGPAVEPIQAPAATRDEILSIHDEAYVAMVEALDRGEPRPEAERFGLGTPDNPVFPGMDRAARWLVGGTLHGARLLMSGAERRVLQLGGGLHHAQKDRAAGFCLYNDLAVAIQAMADHGWRVAYLDLDLHHGDGVQSLFYDSERVLTLSLHESGHYLYPGSGHIQELGLGPAKGLSVNIPLEPFTESGDYLEAFEAVVPRALAWFSPDVLVIQAGADAHFADPLGDLALTTQSFQRLYRRVLDLAEAHARGRALFTLGGGYEAQVVARVWAILYLTVMELPVPQRLPEAWLDRWQAVLGPAMGPDLQDPEPAFPELAGRAARTRRNRDVVARLLDALEACWNPDAPREGGPPLRE